VRSQFLYGVGGFAMHTASVTSNAHVSFLGRRTTPACDWFWIGLADFPRRLREHCYHHKFTSIAPGLNVPSYRRSLALSHCRREACYHFATADASMPKAIEQTSPRISSNQTPISPSHQQRNFCYMEYLRSALDTSLLWRAR
jgi:hypothetical protein